jgi:rubrerythrin
MIMSRARARNDRGRRFEELTDAEIVALAINNEEEASRTYQSFASVLEADYPDSARLFSDMAGEEAEHNARLRALFASKFGDTIPMIAAADVHGIPQESPAAGGMPTGADAMRRRARQMEDDATRFYHQAAARVSDAEVRTVFANLAAAEAAQVPSR